MQSLAGREFGPLNWENACFSRFAEAIEMTAIHHPVVTAHHAEHLASPFVTQGLFARPGDVAGRVSDSEDRSDRHPLPLRTTILRRRFPGSWPGRRSEATRCGLSSRGRVPVGEREFRLQTQVGSVESASVKEIGEFFEKDVHMLGC